MSNQLTLTSFNTGTSNESPTEIVYLKSFLNSLYEEKDTKTSVLFARAFLVTTA